MLPAITARVGGKTRAVKAQFWYPFETFIRQRFLPGRNETATLSSSTTMGLLTGWVCTR